MVRFATLSHDKLCRSLCGELLFYDSHGCVQLLLKGLDLLCNTSLCVCEGEEVKGGECGGGTGEGEEGKTRERCQSNGSFFDPALLSPVSL